jgi:hypothetical protein
VLEATGKDWLTPELIWNAQTRAELAAGLGVEVAKLDYVRAERGQAAWNPAGFEVAYTSYRGMLLVDGYFVELLADALRRRQAANSPARSPEGRARRGGGVGGEGVAFVKEAQRLFLHLYDRAVVERSTGRRVLCVRAMRLLIARYTRELQGLCPVRFVLAELAHMTHLLAQHAHAHAGSTPHDHEDDIDPYDDLLTHPWVRELLLLLLAALEQAGSWASSADMVREMLRSVTQAGSLLHGNPFLTNLRCNRTHVLVLVYLQGGRCCGDHGPVLARHIPDGRQQASSIAPSYASPARKRCVACALANIRNRPCHLNFSCPCMQ